MRHILVCTFYRMSQTMRLRTQPLRKAAVSRTLCSWHDPDDPSRTRAEYNRRYELFLGDGRKSNSDMEAALDKIKVSTCLIQLQ